MQRLLRTKKNYSKGIFKKLNCIKDEENFRMFKMTFEFTDREDTDLRYINAALSGMKLSKLNIEDDDGYLAKRTEFDAVTQEPRGISYRYGFDRLVLEYEADEDETLYTWQVDTQAFAKGKYKDSNAFHDMWCSAHPDRVMRALTQYSFQDADVFVVLHHEKK